MHARFSFVVLAGNHSRSQSLRFFWSHDRHKNRHMVGETIRVTLGTRMAGIEQLMALASDSLCKN